MGNEIDFVKASNFFKKFNTDELKDIARRAGLIPINDALLPFVQDESSLILIRGGRGGGKSNTAAMEYVKACSTQEYFKLFYGRKVLDRVRESQHKELIKAIQQCGLVKEFHYSEQPNGSLQILHKESGNVMLPFGGDNPQSMKSISDPTDVWCDEFDQFTESDFLALYPTLRTLRGRRRFLGTFNSYEVLKSHWIVKMFYPEIYDGSEKYDYSVLENIKISKYLVNFSDNFFIDKEEYFNQLKVAAAGDSELLEGLANGEWGYNRKGNEYYHSFKKSLHTKSINKDLAKPDHLSLDFNVHPYMTLVVCNIEETESEINFNFIKEYCYKEPINSTKRVVEGYLNDYIGNIRDVFYYGDAQGTRKIEGFGSDITRFDDVRSVLRRYVTDYSDRTTRSNPPVLKRRELINKIFSGNAFFGRKKVSIFFDSSMTETIKDFSMCKVGLDGKDKTKVKDPNTGVSYEQYGHTSDAVEYLVCKVLEKLI